MIKEIMGGGEGGGIDIKKIMEKLGGAGSSAGTQPSCQLMLTPPMDMGMTPQGPMVIIGMPFFRTFYTTFDDTDTSNRKVWISKSLRCDGNLMQRELMQTESRTKTELSHTSSLSSHQMQAMQNAKALSSYVAAHGW